MPWVIATTWLKLTSKGFPAVSTLAKLKLLPPSVCTFNALPIQGSPPASKPPLVNKPASKSGIVSGISIVIWSSKVLDAPAILEAFKETVKVPSAKVLIGLISVEVVPFPKSHS